MPRPRRRQRRWRDTVAQHSHTRKFFRQRFRGLQPGETIEIRAISRTTGRVVAREFLSSPKEAAAFVSQLDPALDIYCGINPRRGTDGTKAGVARITCLWADVDAKHFDNDRDKA